MAKEHEASQPFVSFEPHSGENKLRQIQESLESEIEDLREQIERASDRGLGTLHLTQRLTSAMSELATVRGGMKAG